MRSPMRSPADLSLASVDALRPQLDYSAKGHKDMQIDSKMQKHTTDAKTFNLIYNFTKKTTSLK